MSGDEFLSELSSASAALLSAKQRMVKILSSAMTMNF
jgi:hypothetical protein